MTIATRALSGLKVNVSISEADDTLKHGYPIWQVNRVSLQFVSALFGQGASIVFGHDWRDDGVMEAVHGFALQMRPASLPFQQDLDIDTQPLMRNLLPWPDAPRLSAEELEQLADTLRVESSGLPDNLRRFDRDAFAAGPGTAIYSYLRARGLTYLRRNLTAISDARLCIGGRTSGSTGRYPGVVEEALLAILADKPLYVTGILGGASEQVIAALKGRQMPDSFCAPTSTSHIYEHPPIDEGPSDFYGERSIDRNAVWNTFVQYSLERLATKNGLSVERNDELFHTPVVERAIELVLMGLSRLRRG